MCCLSSCSHLVLKFFDADVVGSEVMTLGLGLALQELPDLQLQVSISLLQGAHLLQVGSQTVVEVLHGGLLVGRDVHAVT